MVRTSKLQVYPLESLISRDNSILLT